MKLYLSNVSFDSISTEAIKKYLIEQNTIIEMYSNNGIYTSKNGNGFKKLTFEDGKANILHHYLPDNHLHVDESYVYKSKELASRLPIPHKLQHIQQYHYKIAEKSPVVMVIETQDEKVCNLYFMMMNKHAKYSLPDINNPFTKETIAQLYHSASNASSTSK